MRTFFVKQQDLVSPDAMSKAESKRLGLVEVVPRKDLPLAALDLGRAISQVNLGFAVLSEQLNELAEIVKAKPRKN